MAAAEIGLYYLSKRYYLVWAANFHIQDYSITTPHFTSHLFGSFMARKYKEQYFKIGVMADNSCKQTAHKRVFPPCSNKEKLDLIVLAGKRSKTTSIFDK